MSVFWSAAAIIKTIVVPVVAGMPRIDSPRGERNQGTNQMTNPLAKMAYTLISHMMGKDRKKAAANSR